MKAALASLRFYQGDREELQDELDKLMVESKGGEVESSQGSVKVSSY